MILGIIKSPNNIIIYMRQVDLPHNTSILTLALIFFLLVEREKIAPLHPKREKVDFSLRVRENQLDSITRVCERRKGKTEFLWGVSSVRHLDCCFKKEFLSSEFCRLVPGSFGEKNWRLAPWCPRNCSWITGRGRTLRVGSLDTPCTTIRLKLVRFTTI